MRILGLFASRSLRATLFPGGAAVAQLTVNQLVAGSNPAPGAKVFFRLQALPKTTYS